MKASSERFGPRNELPPPGHPPLVSIHCTAGGTGRNAAASDIDDAVSVRSEDRKSTRLNSSHQIISYAVFCLKKKTITTRPLPSRPLPLASLHRPLESHPSRTRPRRC